MTDTLSLTILRVNKAEVVVEVVVVVDAVAGLRLVIGLTKFTGPHQIRRRKLGK